MTMTVKEIVEKHLKENGFDGLYNEYTEDCGCSLGDDFMECEVIHPKCTPGYKHSGDEEFDYYIMPHKSVEEPKDE
ncbi:hypothetical protein KKF61_07100 [Patescibacteria group bacterium]|nr:hypothetical protein [Patescibacteria group bacterium]